MAEGTCKRVENGQSISVWNDHWLHDQETTPILGLEDMRVSDLLSNQRWNVDLISNILSDRDIHQILNIHVMHMGV